MGLIHQRSNTAGALWKCPSQQQKWDVCWLTCATTATGSNWDLICSVTRRNQRGQTFRPNIPSSLGEVFQICSYFLVVQQDLCRNLLACAFSVSCCILQAFCLYIILLSVWTACQLHQNHQTWKLCLTPWCFELWSVGRTSTLPGEQETKDPRKTRHQAVSGSWAPSTWEPHSHEVVRSSSCVAIAGIWLVVWNEWSSRLPGAVETFCPSRNTSIFGLWRYQNCLYGGAHSRRLGSWWRLGCDLEEVGWTFTFWVQVREALCGSGAQSVPRHSCWIRPTCNCRLEWGWLFGLDHRS